MTTETSRVRITVKPNRAARVTAWSVKCSECRQLNLICRSKINAHAVAQAHNRDVHAQRAIVATAIG